MGIPSCCRTKLIRRLSPLQKISLKTHNVCTGTKQIKHVSWWNAASASWFHSKPSFFNNSVTSLSITSYPRTNLFYNPVRPRPILLTVYLIKFGLDHPTFDDVISCPNDQLLCLEKQISCHHLQRQISCQHCKKNLSEKNNTRNFLSCIAQKLHSFLESG